MLSYLKNLESFSVVTSVAMRFFRNAARSTSKNELLESIRQTMSLACSVLRGRAQKDVLVAAILCSCEKKRYMAFDVPEIKLVSLLKLL